MFLWIASIGSWLIQQLQTRAMMLKVHGGIVAFAHCGDIMMVVSSLLDLAGRFCKNWMVYWSHNGAGLLSGIARSDGIDHIIIIMDCNLHIMIMMNCNRGKAFLL